ncbi:class I SAM-dependent methyltransferase [Flagellimonas zhangzhouensis]|uniref:Methyltransferase domain-containing protein n=1 Tax=Flagellimonas zhangzhouensis TaxID=1073328 RepID=A0A1H2UT25_9FLAO|nr:class I SAM-dependent methyltransferase [Allomuricauda zhangzhouensis]SDQ13980.1 Methyltransferase domain-containing protein [Allomuricauda zhangzhouensis]SDW59261.1 Methyltransferase domain-containing protein [Allomuricauda zhangzhouensis]
MKEYLQTKDFSVSGESFSLLHDEDLDMLVTSPQPKNLSSYYESEDYISHTDASKSLTDKLYQWVKKLNLKSKWSLVQRFDNGSKTVLDIGAGTGDFLVYGKNLGFKVHGVEPNEGARNLSAEKGIQLHSEMKELENRKFHTITLWHVLEHLPNLDKQIEDFVSLLEDEGTLIIAVPNFKSYDSKHYKTFWAAYDVPRHLWHFSKSSIDKLFQKHQMKVIKTKPMVFDAFYVSMLSEKYKGSALYLFKAFLIGLWSNTKALFSKEHSSVIYVLKHQK